MSEPPRWITRFSPTCTTTTSETWPDYNYPEPLTSEVLKNYRTFLGWQVQHNGLRVERIVPGLCDQIVLRRSAGKYPNFEVRNVAANGEVWTGAGTNTQRHFPPLADLTPSELLSAGSVGDGARGCVFTEPPRSLRLQQRVLH